MTFDYEKVKNILVCPKCHAELVHESDSLVCVNPDERCRYPIVDDIPRLLADEATSVDPGEWHELMTRHGRTSESGASD